MLKLLIGPITDMVGSYMNNKAEEKQAKHQAKMNVIQNDADWEAKMADASSSSWKDEWFVILLSLPLLLIGYAVTVDDITIIERVKAGFQALEELPDFYQYLLFIAVSASFGIKGADKLMGLRGPK
tara:strand:+ start:476 stop:853 length:378 start_codon:yes stop_codon:yes gene_type:complete